MGIIDTAIIIMLIVFVFLGLLKGFVKSVFAIAAWVIAFLVPLLLSKPATSLVQKIADGSSFANGTFVFVGLFVLTFIIVKLIGHKLGSSVKKGALGWVDRLLGGIWGAAKALVIISLVLLLMKGIASLPYLGVGLEEFLNSDLKLTETGSGIGKYLYTNNLLPMFLEFILKK